LGVVALKKKSDYPQSLFGQSWYRVAEIKPRLRSHIQFHHHVYRGSDWYVLQDFSSGKFHRFSKESYLIIGMMNGERTMAEIWDAACEALGDDMATQDEVIHLLSYLHQADILQSDMPPDISDLGDRNKREKMQLWYARLRSPAAMNFRLWDPDSFLNHTSLVARLIFSRMGAALWCLTVLLALTLLSLHWGELAANVTERILSAENLALLALIYPVSRLLHELGHAYAVKRWGGEVHEMGIMFVVFFPLPYVDASWSSGFPSRLNRMIVGAAGILVDVFLASLSMIVWVMSEPGTVRVVAYNVLFICGLSTLLLNGNPLIRFDGYYVLSDLLEIPNLADRSSRYFSYLIKRRLFGIKNQSVQEHTYGEKAWLTVYAVLSFLYRIFITFGIIFFIATRFFFIGVVLAIWAAISTLVIPPIMSLRQTMNEISGMRKKQREIAIVVCMVCVGLLAALLFTPFPSYTVTEGVVSAPEEGRVYAGADGFVVKVLTSSGTYVKKGDPLLYCDSPELQAEIKVYVASLNEVQARLRIAEAVDPVQVGSIRDELQQVNAKLERARERASEMVVRSPADGVFILPMEEDWPGRSVRAGSPVGYVTDFSRTIVSVIANQSDIDKIRYDTERVEARLAESPQIVYPAQILRETPEASKDIPSLALSIQGGGKVALDPDSKEAQEPNKEAPAKPEAFEKLYHIEVELHGARARGLGERVFIRLVHKRESLFSRAQVFFRRLLLKRLNV
jgi:putative peptide zinc metalloprotease protein